MIKTPVKFQNNQRKTVGGVVLTSYILPIHFQSIQAHKKFKLKMYKKWKKKILGFSKKHKQNFRLGSECTRACFV